MNWVLVTVLVLVAGAAIGLLVLAWGAKRAIDAVDDREDLHFAALDDEEFHQ